jgi:hypothetical protein
VGKSDGRVLDDACERDRFAAIGQIADPEGKLSHHSNQDEPTQTNDDASLLNGITVAFWLILVAVLHSCFIGFDRRRTR